MESRFIPADKLKVGMTLFCHCFTSSITASVTLDISVGAARREAPFPFLMLKLFGCVEDRRQ
jgi:hypothetical protein